MIELPMISLAVAAVVLFTAGEAGALTLTNHDAVDQHLQITEGGDEAVTRDLVLGADEVLEDLCPDGCVITAAGGQQESFEGHEDVIIEDGRLLVVE